MKVLSAAQIKQWDAFTIKTEPVSSLDLMERAAAACSKWLLEKMLARQYYIFCGNGNNGGDGLAIARQLHQAHCHVSVYILGNAPGSEDFQANLEHLKAATTVPVNIIDSENEFPEIPTGTVLIDALFGTGLNRPLEDQAAMLVQNINASQQTVVSIDIPSGMLCDHSSIGFPIIRADYTFSFQCMKLAFLVAENEPFIGQLHLLDINLHPEFLEQVDCKLQLISEALYQSIYHPRKAFAHKGNFGHALIIAGSYGKMGAAILSTKACLKSGAGLVTAHVPECGLEIMQISAPEAMCKVDKQSRYFSGVDYDLQPYSAIGIGPGIDKLPETANGLKALISSYHRPLVIDADGLNILAENKDWLTDLPENTILTPHPKEFSRLFGDGLNDFQKIETALQKAKELKIVIILKGHHSFIATPGGLGYFNTTGNPGMATGGSGDVLTGILTGLLAQGYSPINTAIAGVYLHGLAGDRASKRLGMNAMLAGDIVEALGSIQIDH
ncbi:bifunctional ADP-dependent NAD(P)H-hydrate dehydratase/NAD(P)H-hydrate epimerase [Niabella terrae]